MKHGRALLALCIGAMMLALCVQIVSEVKAADVEDEMLTAIPFAPSDMKFYDVAFAGPWAVFVGENTTTGRGDIYWYSSDATGSGAWFHPNFVPGVPAVTRFKAIVWNQTGGNGFIVLGDCLIPGYWYFASTNGKVYEYTDASLSMFNCNDLYFDTNNVHLVALGSDTAPNGAYMYEYSTTNATWWELYHGGAPDQQFNGAESVPGGELYLISSTTTPMGIYHNFTYASGYLNTIASVPGLNFTGIHYYIFGPRMLITAANRASRPALWSATGANFTVLAPLSAEIPDETSLTAIDAGHTNLTDTTALAVGYNTTHACIYRIWYDGSSKLHVSLQSDQSAIYAGEKFRSIAIRGGGVPMAVIAGSAFKYSYLNSPGIVVVNTVYPHINYIDMYAKNNNGTSVLNSMADVNPGDDSNWYRLNVSGYFPGAAGGADAIDLVDVYLWHDNGTTGADASGAVDSGWPNLGAHYRWTKGGGFTTVFPLTGESDCMAVHSSATVEAAPLPNFNYSFAFRLNQQIRNASGDGVWSAGIAGVPPSRYMIDDGYEDQLSNAMALDDAYTWDIKVVVMNTTSNATSSAFDEFGIARFVYLGTGASLPGGGLLSGSGAPGQMVILQPSANQNVTFNANCNYDLRMWSTDLFASIPANGVIPALNLSVLGGQWAAYQPLNGSNEANAIWLIGASVPIAYGQPGNTGISNNTWNAPNGGNGVVMRCSVPLGKAEDSYSGTVTYSITPET
ncbi:MAG: hypothetical protein HZB92_00550 [Euryarchaeota archaeon]|nr:hypothetical protein [Euryarchaeota archaeon]